MSYISYLNCTIEETIVLSWPVGKPFGTGKTSILTSVSTLLIFVHIVILLFLMQQTSLKLSLVLLEVLTMMMKLQLAVVDVVVMLAYLCEVTRHNGTVMMTRYLHRRRARRLVQLVVYERTHGRSVLEGFDSF